MVMAFCYYLLRWRARVNGVLLLYFLLSWFHDKSLVPRFCFAEFAVLVDSPPLKASACGKASDINAEKPGAGWQFVVTIGDGPGVQCLTWF